jgi:Family of unknown function (DUF6282)
MRRWLEGACDLHVHADPSLAPRIGSAVDVAAQADRAGLHGLLLKAHEGSTVEMADAIGRQLATLQVMGGVVLNWFVGGLNPLAAETALRLGARCVWFPTVHSLDHERAFGTTSWHGAAAAPVPLTVLEDGRLTAAAREIVALARDHDALLATGHLGWTEIDAVLRAATDLGHTRVLVQHVLFRTPGADSGLALAAAERGSVVELTALAVSPRWRDTSVAACAALLRSAPEGQVAISSDGGQAEEPAPSEMLGGFAQALFDEGVTEATLSRALSETPRRLIGC